MGRQAACSACSLLDRVGGLTQCCFSHRVWGTNWSVSQTCQQSPSHILSLQIVPVCASGFMLPAPRALRVPAGHKHAQPERRNCQRHWGMTTADAALTRRELGWVDQCSTLLASQVEYFWGIFYTISQRPLRGCNPVAHRSNLSSEHPVSASFNSQSHFTTPCCPLLE